MKDVIKGVWITPPHWGAVAIVCQKRNLITCHVRESHPIIVKLHRMRGGVDSGIDLIHCPHFCCA